MKTFFSRFAHAMFCIMLVINPKEFSKIIQFDLEDRSFDFTNSSINVLSGKALLWNINNFVTKNTGKLFVIVVQDGYALNNI